VPDVGSEFGVSTYTLASSRGRLLKIKEAKIKAELIDIAPRLKCRIQSIKVTPVSLAQRKST